LIRFYLQHIEVAILRFPEREAGLQSDQRVFNMKKIVLAAAATMVMASPAYAAPSASDDFVVNATVPNTCTMQNVNDVNLGSLTVSTTAGSNALLLSNDTSEDSNQFWVNCNQNNTMTLTGTVLQGSRALAPGDDSASFTDKINYRVAAVNYKSSGAQPSWSSTGGALDQTSRGPVNRKVKIQTSILSSDNPLRPLAGTYTGTVTVTVTAS
jgi:spore coat protein U-like protein